MWDFTLPVSGLCVNPQLGTSFLRLGFGQRFIPAGQKIKKGSESRDFRSAELVWGRGRFDCQFIGDGNCAVFTLIRFVPRIRHKGRLS